VTHCPDTVASTVSLLHAQHQSKLLLTSSRKLEARQSSRRPHPRIPVPRRQSCRHLNWAHPKPHHARLALIGPISHHAVAFDTQCVPSTASRSRPGAPMFRSGSLSLVVPLGAPPCSTTITTPDPTFSSKDLLWSLQEAAPRAQGARARTRLRCSPAVSQPRDGKRTPSVPSSAAEEPQRVSRIQKTIP